MTVFNQYTKEYRGAFIEQKYPSVRACGHAGKGASILRNNGNGGGCHFADPDGISFFPEIFYQGTDGWLSEGVMSVFIKYRQ